MHIENCSQFHHLLAYIVKWKSLDLDAQLLTHRSSLTTLM